MTEQKRLYGLFTAITMIVGIVIGSGIFFKADNILVYTGGSVQLGILLFCIAAAGIVFGCLTVSQLAALTDRAGGPVAYAESFINPRFAASFGWFQTFLYFPTLTIVVSWVSGIYTAQLMGWDAGLLGQIFLGFLWFSLCFLCNVLSPRIGGLFQGASTITKLLPLFAVAIFGLIFGDPKAAFVGLPHTALRPADSLSWMAGIGPIAFSFDGWIIATTISHEVKDAKRTMPRALVIGPLFILAVYLLYFVGICATLGPAEIMLLGDASPSAAAVALFGPAFAKIFTIIIVVSVVGTVNGIVLSYIQLPYSLALRGMLPGSARLAQTGRKHGVPVHSAILAYGVCCAWWIIHYFTEKYRLLGASDISEVAVVLSYALYLALYFAVFSLWRAGRVHGLFHGAVFPFLACCGSIFVLVAGLHKSLVSPFTFLCLLILAAGAWYARFHPSRTGPVKTRGKPRIR